MGMIRRRTKEKTDKNSIIVSLTTTIQELKEYLNDLKTGKVHNPNQFEEGTVNYINAKVIRDAEIKKVNATIKELQSTLDLLKKDIIAELYFHYDLDGKCAEI